MKQRVVEREKYEKKALNEHSDWEEKDFFDFIKTSPYGDNGARKDTFYDGSLYYISMCNLICWGETSLTLKFLGPFWDRIFKTVFQEVSNVKFKEKRASSFADIYSVKITERKNNYKCTIKDFHQNKIVQFKFKNVTLTKAILKNSIERADMES